MNDPYGLERFERSQAQTLKGYRRLANAIKREATGLPLTRKQRAAQRLPKLDETEIDRNAFRAPVHRMRAPKEMKNRRKPGWTDIQLVVPLITAQGLSTLAKVMADEKRARRASEPLGHRRRYPRTKNYYLVDALNQYFRALGFDEFCVEEQPSKPGRVRRFAAPAE